MVSTSTPRRKRSIRPVTAASHAEQNTMQCTFVHTYMQLQQFRLLMIPAGCIYVGVGRLCTLSLPDQQTVGTYSEISH